MISLQSAEFSNYAAIAKIHAQSWQKNYRNILSDKFLDEEVEKERLEFWQKRLLFPSAHQHVMLAVLDRLVVGFSCLLLDYDPFYGSLLDNLHIDQKFQNSGIGKLLIQNCAATILQKAKTPKMHLWVYEANDRARQVYEHLGGSHLYTIQKFADDGSKARVCRYLWDNVSLLL